MNKAIIVGRLTKDVELRKTQTGKSVANFTVAVNRKFNKDQTDFINCVAWENTAEFLNKYVGKGRLIAVEGSTQTRSYDDKEGKRVFVQEILAESVQALDYADKEKTHDDYMPQTQPEDDIEDEGSILEIDPDTIPF